MAKNKVRGALREMLVIGVSLGILMFVYVLLRGGHSSDSAVDGIIVYGLTGFIFAPAIWAIYRLGRFVFTR